MNPIPGQHDSGPAAISPLDVKGGAEVFAGMIKEVDPRTGQPAAESGAAPADATPASTPGSVEVPPELIQQACQVYGDVDGPVVAEAVARAAAVEAHAREARDQKAHQQHLAAEDAKLAKAIDGWGDPETRAQIVQEIRAWGASQGYSDADLDAVTDHRAVLVAYNALQRGKELAAPRPPAATARPVGDARQHARADREARLQEAYERAAKTHRLRDAGDTFAALLIEKPE